MDFRRQKTDLYFGAEKRLALRRGAVRLFRLFSEKKRRGTRRPDRCGA